MRTLIVAMGVLVVLLSLLSIPVQKSYGHSETDQIEEWAKYTRNSFEIMGNSKILREGNVFPNFGREAFCRLLLHLRARVRESCENIDRRREILKDLSSIEVMVRTGRVYIKQEFQLLILEGG